MEYNHLIMLLLNTHENNIIHLDRRAQKSTWTLHTSQEHSTTPWKEYNNMTKGHDKAQIHDWCKTMFFLLLQKLDKTIKWETLKFCLSLSARRTRRSTLIKTKVAAGEKWKCLSITDQYFLSYQAPPLLFFSPESCRLHITAPVHPDFHSDTFPPGTDSREAKFLTWLP